MSLRDDVRRVQKEALVHTYREGLGDGIEMVLDQLQTAGLELTDEIRDWIATVRARHDQVRSELQ